MVDVNFGIEQYVGQAIAPNKQLITLSQIAYALPIE